MNPLRDITYHRRKARHYDQCRKASLERGSKGAAIIHAMNRNDHRASARLVTFMLVLTVSTPLIVTIVWLTNPCQ